MKLWGVLVQVQELLFVGEGEGHDQVAMKMMIDCLMSI